MLASFTAGSLLWFQGSSFIQPTSILRYLPLLSTRAEAKVYEGSDMSTAQLTSTASHTETHE